MNTLKAKQSHVRNKTIAETDLYMHQSPNSMSGTFDLKPNTFADRRNTMNHHSAGAKNFNFPSGNQLFNNSSAAQSYVEDFNYGGMSPFKNIGSKANKHTSMGSASNTIVGGVHTGIESRNLIFSQVPSRLFGPGAQRKLDNVST